MMRSHSTEPVISGEQCKFNPHPLKSVDFTRHPQNTYWSLQLGRVIQHKPYFALTPSLVRKMKVESMPARYLRPQQTSLNTCHSLQLEENHMRKTSVLNTVLRTKMMVRIPGMDLVVNMLLLRRYK